MKLKAFLRSFFGSKRSSTSVRANDRRRFRPTVEMLEDRLAPAIFTVNSALDSDDGLALNATTTLRKALRLANAMPAADTINFAAALTNKTITLGGTELAITNPVTITGLGSTHLTIDANNASRIFKIDDSTAAKVAVSISGLRLTNGSSDSGGAIFNKETLTLAGSLLDHNSSSVGGGGIYNQDAPLTLTNTTLSANSASASGGGIYNGFFTVVALTNVTFAGNSAGNSGGGIFLSSGTLTVTNSTFSVNSATMDGGGIQIDSSFSNPGTLTASNTTLSGNSAGGNGGGIDVVGNGSTLTLTNATLATNSATTDGGGIYISKGTTSLTNATLNGNFSHNGAGIYLDAGTLTVMNSSFTGNTVTDFGDGGGLYNAGGIVMLANSLLFANSADLGGGAFNDSNGVLTVTDSILNGNSGPEGGGGIHSAGSLKLIRSTLSANSTAVIGGGLVNDGELEMTGSSLVANSAELGGGLYNNGQLEMSDSTVSGNSASDGGGLYQNEGIVEVRNSTFSGNSAGNNGGGIANMSGNFFLLVNCTIVGNRATLPGSGGGLYVDGIVTKLRNSIVAGNMTFNLPDDLSGPDKATGVFTIIGDPFTSDGITDGDSGNIVGKNGGSDQLPLEEILDPTLRNNGGPTLTHALIRTSPAIDAGDNGNAPSGPFDQRGPGFSRFVAGQVDIGAFEMPAPTFSDSFTRPEGPSLGSPWVTQIGAFGIVGVMQKLAVGSAALNVATLAGVTAADLDLYVNVVVKAGHQYGLLARYAGSGDQNYYLASLTSDAAGNVVARLVRNVNGVVTELAVVEEVPPIGAGLLRFRIVGSTLQLFLNGTLLATAEDTTFKSGSIGLRSTGSTAFDNFQAFPVTTGADNLDLFTHPDHTTLSDPWTQPVGYFRTLANQIQGGQALNLAVFNAVHQPDVDVQASVSITGQNHSAGLLARYQGTGDSNYYLGKLTRTSTGFTAVVLKNIAGTVTTLATTAVNSTTGKANLRFLVTGANLTFFVNNIPVANLMDSSLANGSVGIRADGYASLDNFHASAVTTDLPFNDSFGQGDSTALNDHWTRRAGNFKVMGNAAVGTSAAPAVNLATLVGVKQGNIDVQADVALIAVTHEIGLLASYTGPGDANYYMARVLRTAAGFNLSIVKNVGGVPTALKSLNVAALTGTIELHIEGTRLSLLMNSVEQLSVIDGTFPAGSVGIRSIGTGTIDNFTAPAVTFLPFSDSFPSASGPNLSANWTTRTGGYSTASGMAKATAALNLATLGRFDQADVDVLAAISVASTAGQFASLAARYSGGGDLNMYLATVTWDGTQFVASISKRINGVTTQLASLAIGSGTGTLRFTVVGSLLKLSIDGTDLLSVFDFSLKSGSVGIRSSLNSTFDNFILNQAS